MFFEALQSYFAPFSTLFIFIIILCMDKIFSKYVKRLFLIKTALIGVIILATWADRCLSVMYLNGMAWKWRTLTTFLNFSLSPIPPMILSMIYYKNEKFEIKRIYYYLVIINFFLCVASIFTGWIFSISPDNVYKRGPLFIFPFLVSGFYMLSMIHFTMKQKDMPSRKSEAFFLILIMIITAVASILEVAFVVRFMLWSTTEITVIIYFLVLTTQELLYDPLTGVFSKVAYSKKLEQIREKGGCTIAIIDMNNLKLLNDTYGHSAGNRAILNMSKSVLRSKKQSMRLYRYAGDEFVLIDKFGTADKMHSALDKAQNSCGWVDGVKISFAFGIAECENGDDLDECFAKADREMYKQKRIMKNENSKNL